MKIKGKDFFIITGLARSGTTYLSNLLNSHPSCNSFADPINVFFKAFLFEVSVSIFKNSDSSMHNPVPNWFLESAIKDYIHGSRLEISLNQDRLDGFLKAIINNCESFVPGAAKRMRRIKNAGNFMELFLQLAESVYNSDSDNITHFGIKTAWSEGIMPTMINTFPDLKVIHIIRDPRAVIASNYKTMNKRYPVLYNVRDWRKSVYYYQYLKKKYPGNYLMVKYEDLLSDYDQVLAEVLGFIGLETSVEFSDVLNTNSSYQQSVKDTKEYIERWRSNMPVELATYVEKTCSPEMKKLGYHDHVGDYHFNPKDGLIDFNSLSGWCRDNFQHTEKDYLNWINDQNALEELRLSIYKRRSAISNDIADAFYFDQDYFKWLTEN